MVKKEAKREITNIKCHSCRSTREILTSGIFDSYYRRRAKATTMSWSKGILLLFQTVSDTFRKFFLLDRVHHEVCFPIEVVPLLHSLGNRVILVGFDKGIFALSTSGLLDQTIHSMAHCINWVWVFLKRFTIKGSLEY